MKINKYFKSWVLLLCGFAFVSNIYGCQLNSIKKNILTDTVITGKLIDTDSIFINSNSNYFGQKYYYGVYHLKVGVINPQENKIVDTIIIAYVYNMISEISEYLKKFDLCIQSNYIFYVDNFKPCESDFPRIQGRCSDDGYFIPESNKLIKKYKTIPRLINVFNYAPISSSVGALSEVECRRLVSDQWHQ